MIKAENLMIGDWVLFEANDTHNKYVCQVEVLYPREIVLFITNGIVMANQRCAPEQVEPIPLTPEILEKNGFAKIDENTFEIWQGQDVGESIYVKTDMQIIAYKPCHSMICDTMPLNYVHELQHILRILKIKKEILL